MPRKLLATRVGVAWSGAEVAPLKFMGGRLTTMGRIRSIRTLGVIAAGQAPRDDGATLFARRAPVAASGAESECGGWVVGR